MNLLDKLKKKFESIRESNELERARRQGFWECIKIIKESGASPIVNLELMNTCSVDELLEMGFITHYDGVVLGDKEPETAWGIHYELASGHFQISIDCALCVTIENKNTDSDPIPVFIEDKDQLQSLIHFTK